MPKGRFRSTFKAAGYRMATPALRTQREGKRLRLVDVAREAGMTEGMVAMVERGKTSASPVLQLAYARKLGPLHGLFDPHAELTDDEAISHRQATLLLHTSHRRVTALCLDDVLPHARDGRSWKLGRGAVASIAADRLELREKWISFKRIEREYRELPAWLLEQLESEGRLRVRHQDRDRLARRDDVEDLLGELRAEAAHARCPGCGKPPKPGRKWHMECVGRELGGDRTGRPRPWKRGRAPHPCNCGNGDPRHDRKRCAAKRRVKAGRGLKQLISASWPSEKRLAAGRTIGRRKKGRAPAIEVGNAALRIVKAKPHATETRNTRRALLEALMLEFTCDRATIERGTADAGYRAARMKIERRLRRAYDELDQPSELAPLV